MGRYDRVAAGLKQIAPRSLGFQKSGESLDEASIGRSGPDIEHERAAAIYDLLEDNSFAPVPSDRGPFKLHLSITGNRLLFDIRRANDTPVMAHLVEMGKITRADIDNAAELLRAHKTKDGGDKSK